MSESKHVVQFASRLRGLKERTNRSYAALAKRIGIGSSTLHRYCSGRSIPSDYRIIVSFAKACELSKEETDQLLRSWVLSTLPDRVPRSGDSISRESPGRRPQVADRIHAANSRSAKRALALPRAMAIVGAALTLLVSVNGLVRSSGTPAHTQRPDQQARLLLSGLCADVLAKGEYGVCAQELQSRLRAAGFMLPVDAAFGPYTKMRVEAFQLLAGLPSTGMVDENTKNALYAAQVKVVTWSRDQVERRVREVFPEDADNAINLVRCLSALDPLWISGHKDLTRSWGLFQFHDRELVELGISPTTALEPAWNIQAARAKWSTTKDFSRWACQPMSVPPPQ